MKKLKVIKITDKEYPENLKKIKKPPVQLYYEGDINLLKNKIVSIIGSRACSNNGAEIAYHFAKELSMQNVTIASGMAEGIDTSAHNGALKGNGKTIAVLGNGLENIFPKENINLYKEIIKNGGLVITEYAPTTKASSKNFLERNRIVSGIAKGILVIEAAYRSGTSVTARFAKEQGKIVFAIPHEINNYRGVGTNKLIKEGAILVTTPKNIIDKLPGITFKKMKQFESYFEYIDKKHIIFINEDYKKVKEKEKYVKNSVQKEQKYGKIIKLDNMKLCKRKCKNAEYNKIYDLINEHPITIDEICKKSLEPIDKVNNVVLMLEIEDYIKKEAGGYVCILEK